MGTILRAAVVYVAVMVILRLAGRRTLGEMTSFDLVLLLIISEATQDAMIGEDRSLTGSLLAIATLIVLDVGLSILKLRSRVVDKWVDGLPTVLVEDGRALKDRMEKARVDLQDILSSAREHRGLERLEQIKYAVLESGGKITIVPKPADPPPAPRDDGPPRKKHR